MTEGQSNTTAACYQQGTDTTALPAVCNQQKPNVVKPGSHTRVCPSCCSDMTPYFDTMWRHDGLKICWGTYQAQLEHIVATACWQHQTVIQAQCAAECLVCTAQARAQQHEEAPAYRSSTTCILRQNTHQLKIWN